MKELITIQSELKAPKSQRNTFGNYNYRTLEDILEAVKPLLKKEKCTLTITDDVVMVGDRTYIKATATLVNEKGDKVSTTAFAREPLSKPKFDESQVTGSASSYARKYALNGLFCIDDTKDADTLNVDKSYTQPQQTPQPETAKVTNIDAIKLAISLADSESSLLSIWNDTPTDLRAKVKSAFTNRKKELIANKQ